MVEPVASPGPAPSKGAEFRRYPRTVCKNATVICTDAILPGGGSTNLALRVVDVSFSGACIVSGELLPLGARLKTNITFEEGQGGITATAEVVWSRSVQHNAKTYFLAGLNYMDRPEFLSGTPVSEVPIDQERFRSTNVHELKEGLVDKKTEETADDALEAILGDIESEPLPLNSSDAQGDGAVVTTAPPLPASMMGARRREPPKAAILVASFLIGVALAFALAWATGGI